MADQESFIERILDKINSLSTSEKVAAALAAALAVSVAVVATQKALPAPQPDNKKKPTRTDSGSGSAATAEPSTDAAERIRLLKAEGNEHYKHRRWDDAILAYTEALKLQPGDPHVYYSNRSATFFSKHDFQRALEDAETVIQIHPKWAKGYFRKGKALAAMGKFDDAYSAFFEGQLSDPENDELKRMLEQTQTELGIGDLDTRSRVETKLIEQHLEEIAVALCTEKLSGISFHEFRDAIKATANQAEVDALPIVQQAIKVSPVDAYRLMAQVLLFDVPSDARNSDAKAAVDLALELDPTNGGANLVASHIVLRLQDSDMLHSQKAALRHVRAALRALPNGVLVAHTLASILVRISPYNESPIPDDDLRVVLEEMIPAFMNRQANPLLIADAGLRLWFRLFDAPEIKQQFQDEEQQHRQGRLPERVILLKGLETGSYSKLVREKFFLQVLSRVVLVNHMLEKLLVPFRQAVALEKKGAFGPELEPFCYALALQCYKNHYSWNVSDEEKNMVDHIAKRLRSALADEDAPETQLDPETKRLNPTLKKWLGFLALYRNIDEISEHPGALASVLRNADLSQEQQWFRELLQKTVLDRETERELNSSIKTVTSSVSCPDDLQAFYNSHLFPLWDLVQPSVTKRSIGQEMRWLFPHHEFLSFETAPTQNNRVLVAGCGSGMDVQQLSSQYHSIDVVALDISKKNLAYAQRECSAGVSTFVHGDIMTLKPEDLGADKQPFDLCTAQSVLHHLSDPIQGWKNLVGCLRPGGLFTGAVYNQRYIKMLRDARVWFRTHMDPPVFDDDANLPRLLRHPSDDELRQARSALIEVITAFQMPWMQRGNMAQPPDTLQFLCAMPQFYNLEQFRDLIFHPSVVGFDFTTLGEVLQQVGLKLVSFEFPSIAQDKVLQYRVMYPDDPHMLNCANLDKFDLEHELLGPMSLQMSPHYMFIAEKPAQDANDNS